MARYALVSVSDKSSLVPFARRLVAAGFKLLSTGGTGRALTEAGIAMTSVADHTESPEVMGGRVKTLHPRIHGGILARPEDEADLATLGAGAIDLVVCNLYPFQETIARPDVSRTDAIENIDIGGPSMLRSAAKNHARVTVVCDPADYDRVAEGFEQHGTPAEAMRRELAQKAFAHTAVYDTAIAAYLLNDIAASQPSEVNEAFPPSLNLTLERVSVLRYGENPHQGAAFYRSPDATTSDLARAQEVGAGKKALSFNNLVDLHAAIEAVREIDRPAAVVVKHTNPCGLATHASLAEAYRRARAGDPVSAFGGIVALNRPCDLETAEAIAETFIECVAAPSFTEEAQARLIKKKKLRLVKLETGARKLSFDFKKISGGFVVQHEDPLTAPDLAESTVATKRVPTDAERRDLAFAWAVCKHVKSNAIVYASGEQVVGVGAGQMSRVKAVELAGDKAAERSRGAVMASDAFFPFPDGLEAAASHGITAVVQPGGSIKDDAVIAAADAAGIAMIMTGRRHFRH